MNPFKYRGYYYDTDLGLYYLQSRYYDSQTGRFINPDSALYHHMVGYNMMAYCNNDPVNMVDPTGTNGEEVLYKFFAVGAGAGALDGPLPLGIWSVAV